MPILNYTTTVNTEKTLMEIKKKLLLIGVSAVLSEYDSEGVMTSLSFRIEHNNVPIMFRMPARIDRIYRILCDDPDVPRKLRSQEQAARVSWRIIKDWIEAQVAIIQAEQVDVIEVFLPYAQDPRTGKTMYQGLKESNFGLLTHNPN